ncbi:MAG: DUF4298 domain-containing protein [Muribaculaceae bacterium]|nr:DUF4298 domain-containing protein [Muribaculaceae bacterium]
MDQIQRIQHMETLLRQATQAVEQLQAALDRYQAARQAITQLADYYTSPQWRRDYEADEAHRLPQDLKRGVLSQDTIWNLLDQDQDLRKQMQTLL